MKKLADVQVSQVYEYTIQGRTVAYERTYLSLSKLLDQPITDIIGRVSEEFGEPVFKAMYVMLASGSQIGLNGEHDIAYVEDYSASPGLAVEQLQALYDEEYGEEDN